MKFQLSTDMSKTEAMTYFPFLMDSMTRSSSYPRKFETPVNIFQVSCGSFDATYVEIA